MDPAEAAAWLSRNTVDSLPDGGLQAKLSIGRPLRVKLGIDPTAPDIHLGFTVVLQKLREFQDLGHTVVLIIGDYTARVGDPSGRTTTRPVLTGEEIDANAVSFQQQAAKVLDSNRLEVVRNGEWLDMKMAELFRLMGAVTVAQVLERDDFAKRYASGSAISMLELLYPLLQGYDSVAVRADVELGGADQKFNLLLGRDIQRHYGLPEQVIMTMPLLTGTDGVRKMSKSVGNYIGVSEAPEEIYGKTVSIPDESMGCGTRCCSIPQPPANVGPWDAKRALARALVERFHGPGDAAAAQEAFDRVHRRRELPAEVPVLEWELDGTRRQRRGPPPGVARACLRSLELRGSAKHHPAGGQARWRHRRRDTLDLPRESIDGRVLQLGKRHFVRVRVR